MANEDSVMISINKKFTGESPVFSDHCIFKVPKELRSVNEEAYEPQLIAIGPYHHEKDHLLVMEDHKIRYLQNFLKRSGQENVLRYVQTIRSLEERARKCYAESLSFDHDKFVEMMLIDGCFIIEFICKLLEGDMEDPLLRSNHTLTRFMLDLLLLENQLPFFILQGLLVTSNSTPDQQSTFIKVILVIYKSFLPGPLCNSSCAYTPENMIQIKNLLELLHDHWQPSPARLEAYKKMRQTEERGFTRCATYLKEAGIKFKSVAQLKEVGIKFKSTRCATELKDAGIKFKSAVERDNLFDIDFVNGTIKIPKIQIEDKTECVLRNLIAYEQLTSSTSPKYFTDYMIFMDSLINSKKDVELLCRKGIIDNWKGDDETIAVLFNNLGEQVFCERNLYADIVNNVNKHCKKRRNLWMAKLRHDYFQSPWSLISVLAAIILLLLAMTQTVYSVLSYYK
ncbi:UPF0481 protein At3g47200 isoform X3 [Manihot esculenta]|uniref:Uncharacterized protein n=2 Tax=Manihot esculenta TaxID=3983 RepID=A0A2C9W7M7_MANES|nr:UPF0481 protein At3g47200 isoform X3 [Manihot esculenta]XP_021606994.1 UPF0481 protein At3g47200 isoform X3 [Manihot esculenta]OAY55409.1 hypothetical protein MANES_03G151700v8 [Manihot esculenta]